MHLTLLNSFLAEANCLEYKKKLLQFTIFLPHQLIPNPFFSHRKTQILAFFKKGGVVKHLRIAMMKVVSTH